MTASKAAPAATASLSRNSDVTIDRKRLDGWFAKVIAVADRLGPTDAGLTLAVIAGDMAMVACGSSQAVRTLAAIDADITAVDLLTGELKGQTFRAGLEGEEPYGTKIRNLRRERGKLVLERAELLERQQGVSPEDVGIVSLANHDRRQGRSRIVIELDGRRYTAAVTEDASELLARQMARDAGLTF